MEKDTPLEWPQFQSLSEIPLVYVSSANKPLRILLLADDRHAANVVMDHIAGFGKYSRHEYVIRNPIHDPAPSCVNLVSFDAILIHYSIYVLGEYFLPPAWRRTVADFPRLKAQIIQDEQRNINAMKERMAELGVSAIFSSLAPATAAKTYYGDLLRNVFFFSCLPGYIPEPYHRFDPPKISDRPLDVVYRGRTLPAYLGRHAQEKKQIGDQIETIAGDFGLKVDISSDESRRIYGKAWPDFMMSGRATLGVEGGASIFDFDGQLSALVTEYQRANPDAGFEEIWQRFLKDREGNVVHKTLTPKIFEAIATKTALILYPGVYRGVLEPGRHYIELARDGSNIRSVVARVKDHEYLQEMVDMVHREILSRYDLSAEFYVSQIDNVLATLGRVKENSALRMLRCGVNSLKHCWANGYEGD